MMGDRRIAHHLVIRGRVQGVFFRSSTRQTAERNRVTGWARNRADGSVEAWLEGSPDDVETVEAWIHAGGPPAAVVRDVAVEVTDPVGYERFTVR
jgi:acylphosphatase